MSDNNEALNHAWKWFEYHATQRLIMIRFYILAAGAIGAGIGYLYAGEFYKFSALFSSFGVVVSVCFLRLDQRVSDLIKFGEAALKMEQDKLALATGHEALKICESADDPKKRGRYPYSYKENFKLLFYGALVLFTLTLISSLVEICSSPNGIGGY